MSFAVRALELHGRHIWQRASILRALDFIRAHGLNALVLHETDLVQMVTYPRSYLDPYGLWRSAPTRRGENAIENNRVYLTHVCNLAAKAGVALYVEVKEIGFPDEILELRPELLKGGVVCPSEPFWAEFIERKTDEFFADFPGIAGMLSSAGSTEGKASRSQNKCSCEQCARTPLEDWYDGIIQALHRATQRHGKRLAVRDFAYKPVDHEPLIAAVARAPADVVFCVKATPHDFYPTFPDNPAIGRLQRPQWIEYDTMGQFYGWGVFPCLMLDDIKARLAHAQAHGAEGVSFRVEWERINDYWCLDTLNAINTIAGAAVAKDPGDGADIDVEAVCRMWLDDQGYTPAAAPALARLLGPTWEVIRGALYLDDFVFADNSMYPRSLRRAWWGMEVRDALHTWDPSKEAGLTMTRERVIRLIADKQRALASARALAAQARYGDPLIPLPLHRRLVEAFDRTETYVEGFVIAAEICALARWADPRTRADAGPGPQELAQFAAALDRLDALAASLRSLDDEAPVPHQIVMLMDHRRLTDIAREGRMALSDAQALLDTLARSDAKGSAR